MLTRRFVAGGLTALSLPLTARAGFSAAPEPVLSREALRSDLELIVPTLERIHPDLSFTADPAGLRRRAAALAARIDRPMSVRQAWPIMAMLNPLFRDAHVGLRHPVDEFDGYRSAGGPVFPAPVFVDRDGRLRIGPTAPDGLALAPFDIVEAINGVSSDRIIADMAPLMRGETPSLQRFVMAVNFPALFWTLYGPQPGFRVRARAEGAPSRLVTASGTAPDASGPRRAGDMFAVSAPAPGVALLKVRTFDPALKAEFAAFVDGAFARIARDGARTLIIDIRDNPGGAHDLSDLLVARLADRPVQPASRLVARITADNRDLKPDAKEGDVVSVAFDEPIQPAPERFPGKVFVLVSQDTYSQAIVFAVTLKDHGLASIVGETTGGNANETGQITLNPLPHTRLQVLAPLYVIYRPSGDETVGGLRPDVALPHRPEKPQEMVEALLGRL